MDDPTKSVTKKKKVGLESQKEADRLAKMHFTD